MRRTLTVTGSPTRSRSPARSTRACESSDIGTSPCTPPRSTNAPKSASETTVPGNTASGRIFLRVSTAARSACSSSSARRESTRLRPPSAYFVTRNSSTRPTYSCSDSTRRSSICENGQKARKPPTVTSYPPLITPATLPSTGTPVCAATASASRAWAPCRRRCESRISSPVATTVASISSPTLTLRRPSSSASSAGSIHASPSPPTSTNTCSSEIWMTRPFTIWPISSVRRASCCANIAAKSSSELGSLMGAQGIIFPLPGGAVGGRPKSRDRDATSLTLAVAADEPDGFLASERVRRDRPGAAAGRRGDLAGHLGAAEGQRQPARGGAHEAEARLRRRVEQRREHASGPVRGFLRARLRRLGVDGEDHRRCEQHQHHHAPQDLAHALASFEVRAERQGGAPPRGPVPICRRAGAS